MRRILYVTGTRADYGPARSTLRAIDAQADFDLRLLVTGMHLDPVHGETWRELERDGFRCAAKIPSDVPGDTLESMAASIGRALEGMAHAIADANPAIVLLLGDRGEQLAAATAAAVQNVVVAHLCGGSVSGSIDDAIRHAITKLSHYHLPASQEHARRIVQMGEDPSRVFVVGLPGGDIRGDVTYSRDQVCSACGIPSNVPYVLVVQHAVTHSQAEAGNQIVETLEALVDLGATVLLGNPNNDAGGRVILATMREFASRYPHFRILEPPASRQKFASIMAHASAVVGNSSSGIVEATSVPVPVVNIGDRQQGREHHSCVLNADYDRTAIRAALDRALDDPEYRRRLLEHHSDMLLDTEARVVEVLRSLDLSVARCPKPFVDIRGE